LIYLAPTKPNNLEEQNRLMDDVIARQVDGIVLAPVDSAGVVPAIERAVAAGIPVAVSATGASTDQIVTYSGTDNYEGMKMVAEYVAEALDYQGKVVVLDGLLGATVGQDRRRGVDETLEQYPDIEILGRQDAEMQRAKGMQVMENLLQAYPEIDAVIAANDEEALGAIEALDAAGRLQDTIVSGFDGNNDALKAVRDGRMLVTLVQGPEKMAVDAIKAILDARAGKDVPKRLVTEMILATQDNIDQFADRIGE
jgi:ribose transport system substrate-binding protein